MVLFGTHSTWLRMDKVPLGKILKKLLILVYFECYSIFPAKSEERKEGIEWPVRIFPVDCMSVMLPVMLSFLFKVSNHFV